MKQNKFSHPSPPTSYTKVWIRHCYISSTSADKQINVNCNYLKPLGCKKKQILSINIIKYFLVKKLLPLHGVRKQCLHYEIWFWSILVFDSLYCAGTFLNNSIIIFFYSYNLVKSNLFPVTSQRCFINFSQLQVNQVAVRRALLFHCSAFPKYTTKKQHCFVDEFLQISQ